MKTDCIEWKGAINSSGYGVTWKGGKTVYAHRAIIDAQEDEIVMHTCDNKKCVNPHHLKFGTYAENSQDMVDKGRQAKGEQCGNVKLIEEHVYEIRKLNGLLSSREVAKQFSISKTNVLDIWKGRIWKHLT